MTKDTLHGKRIWLIGASHGIGAALSRRLLEEGATLVISARSQDRLEALASEDEQNCTPAACDVTDIASIHQAWDAARAKLGEVDMVIYNAGAYEPMSAADFNLETAETIIDVNLRGAVRTVHTVLPYLKDQQHGKIVLVGSVAGYRGLPNAMGYGLSKAGVIHLAENLRQDLDGSGIDVAMINPGFVKTRLTKKNTFAMPMRISPERAAEHIIHGLKANRFEIHFPKGFTWPLKCIAALPASLYFWLSDKLMRD